MLALIFAATLITQDYDGLISITSGYTAKGCAEEKARLLKRDDFVSCFDNGCWSTPLNLMAGQISRATKAKGIRVAECIP